MQGIISRVVSLDFSISVTWGEVHFIYINMISSVWTGVSAVPSCGAAGCPLLAHLQRALQAGWDTSSPSPTRLWCQHLKGEKERLGELETWGITGQSAQPKYTEGCKRKLLSSL